MVQKTTIVYKFLRKDAQTQGFVLFTHAELNKIKMLIWRRTDNSTEVLLCGPQLWWCCPIKKKKPSPDTELKWD